MANVSSLDEETIIATVNNRIFQATIPNLVYVSLLMVFGIPGNVLVYLYYGSHVKTSTHVFILTLTTYDIISCVLSMPAEIVETRYYYGNIFSSSIACKLLRFQNFTTAFGSVFTLIVIATDRFSRVCRYKRKQMTISLAKTLCGIVAMAAVIVSWPALVLYQPIRYQVNDDSHGLRCGPSTDKEYTTYIHIFNNIHFIIFGFSTVALGLTYAIVSFRIYKHYKKLRLKQNSNPLISYIIASQNKTKPRRIPESVQRYGVNILQPKSVPSVTSMTSMTSNSMGRGTMKITVVMVTVTICFVMSYLPYLVLKLWTAQASALTLTLAENAGYRIGIRSFLLNSAVNPLIYGFFNSSFRKYFGEKLGCCRLSDQSSSETSAPSS